MDLLFNSKQGRVAGVLAMLLIVVLADPARGQRAHRSP